MRFDRLGEDAWIIRVPDDVAAWPLARRIESLNLPGVLDVAPAFYTIGLVVDPLLFDEASLQTIPAPSDVDGETVGRVLRVPVCYELGPDLQSVADQLAIEPTEVVALHANRPYTCYAVGFRPGFPYLGMLPKPLDQIGRLPEPRTRVEAGSVAIAAGQTGIYPRASPGGWHCIGLTPVRIADPERAWYPVEPGDVVIFVPISRDRFEPFLGHDLDEWDDFEGSFHGGPGSERH